MTSTPENKRALLARLLREKTQKVKQAPLSFSQERMWFLHQWNSASAAFNMPGAVRLRGALDVQALRRALQELVRRHETLRTHFIDQDGRPLQVISPTLELPLVEEDLRDVAPERREARAQERITDEARRPFELSQGPLLRALLLRLAEHEHVLVLSLHHIVADGWSLGVLIRELGALYAAFIQGQGSPLPALPLQYAEFATWQRDWLQGEVLESQLAWWRERLDPNALLELPTDRPRPAALSSQGARLTVWLPPALLKPLKGLAQREGKTLYVVLLAAFETLLQRYTGQEDLVVGTPIAGRSRSELEGMIGLFINTLALRTSLAGRPTFRELMGRVHQTTVDAFAHPDVPFEKLMDALKPERRLSHSPVFQVMFILQNAPMPPLMAPGLAMEFQQPETGTAKVELTLVAAEEDERLRLTAEYNTQLFESATIGRLLEHYQTLLAAIVADADQPIDVLPLLSEQERHTVLTRGLGPVVEHPRDTPVARLIEAQVARTPEAVAVIQDGRSLTYAELNTRANQLARQLRALGVGPEVPVAVSTSRSPDMVVALLGILKSGGAYVPLDPTYPRERLDTMLANSKARVLVSESHLDSLARPGKDITRLDVDTLVPTAEDVNNPPSLVTADNLAYIIYTSGSTGQPKGVQVLQRTAVHFLTAFDPVVERPERGVWLAITGISFDPSVLELLWTLTRGFTLVVPADTLGTAWLTDAVRQHAVTHLQCTPSRARSLLLDPDASEALRSLRQLFVGGEAMSIELATELRERVPSLVNLYGPTEITVWASAQPVSVPIHSAVPLGRSIANTHFYVLDERMQPVPLGIQGELFIGGEGVTRGYLDQPELTARHFVPDPFTSTPGARLYRTGDRVRRRADDRLEFLGRVDFQVKVRGFRIELGEIEVVLSRHASVRQCLVVAREARAGDLQLVAYVTSTVGMTATDTELRAHLQRQLPGYMVPSAILVLEQMPLSPNGKVDRKALPVPDAGGARETYVAPSTFLEEQLATLWTEVLAVPRVGAEDDFFLHLGGHSLLATQVMSRVRTALQVELPVRALFEAPTLSAFARKIEAARGGPVRHVVRAPTPRPPTFTGELPLSFSQQRLWFLDQLEPGSPFYNVPAALRISGPLDASALQQAFTELVRRHESLRTTFTSSDGQPVQRITPTLALALEVKDLRDVPSTEREGRAQELARQEALRPFELAHGPLLRTCLLRLAPENHVLLVVMHHIVSDGWSMGVLIREVTSLYASFAAGQRPSLPPLPVQYADFALWQRSWLQGEVLYDQLAFWKRQLSGAPSHLELPTDKPRPTVQSFRGDTLPVALPKALSDSLRDLSQQLGVTPFMTLLAGFQLLLHRYSSQDDVCVGSPIAGRRSTELEGLIGFFVNTVVLRSRVSASTSFRQYLHQVRDTTLAAFEHQDLPFEKLVEHLQPQRDLSRSPLFQVMFVLQNAPAETLSVPGLSMRPLELASDTAKFDWTLTLTDRPTGFSGHLEFNRDLFERDTVARAMAHLQVLLSAAVSSPDMAVARLPLLPQAESHKLLVEWNHLPLDYPRDACLHDLFEAQALRTPHAEALVDGSRSLSYAELDARSTQLAHSLRALGVSRETPVGICSKRSAELVVGLLAILKAGGFYVPLDPAYPQDRLSFIIHDSNLRFLLAHSQVVDSLPSHSAHVLLLDSQPRESAPVAPLEPSASSNNIAYLIYTSGSTGRPKGVCIEHRNAVSFLSWARSVFSPEMLSSTLAATSIAFDLSVFELFLPLSLGGTVVLASNALELPALPAASRVSLVNTVPSVMSELLRSSALPPSVRVVNLAGEPLSSSLVQLLHQQPGVSLVYDLYGPSETTTYSTFTLRLPQQPASIGRPISGTQVFLLDPLLQPVPLGVPGELFIGGEGVSRGYLGRPELTAERFIPHPFSSTPGARLYRTGDLARYRADGTLEYLGRTDFQVKIRGFRIELGEIETLLSTHPGVRQAVVLAREDQPGDKRLVAYVTASGSQPPDSSQLRSFLKQQLPEHMLPSAFMCLEQLPLTPNGKINRKALPIPELAASNADYIAPRTPTEEKLAALWAEVLGVPRVGAEDHFFSQLGGHSLLATRIVSRMRSTFQVELSVRALFESPILSALARRIDEAHGQTARGVLRGPSPRSADYSGALPLSFSQQRLWFLDQLEPGSPFYNVPAALRVSGPLDASALQQAFTELVRRHESLRTTFTSSDGQPVQRITPALALSLEVKDLRDVPSTEREGRAQELARQEALRPFELAHGPLLRTCLLRLAPEDHVLLVVMHHIVSDGWSMGVLIREVTSLYASFAAGQRPSLPPLPVQYADFALWQHSRLQGEVLDAQLSFWKQQLSGAPSHLELPTDKPRPTVQSFRGDSLPVALPKALSESLKAFSQQLGVTPFMTLLAGFQLLLHRYSSQDDVCVGSPIAGRRSIELEGLIGFFVNTVVLRSRVSASTSFRQYLHQVRDTTLAAFEHQDLPFEKLVEHLQPQRDLSRSPLFQVMFVLQNAPAETLSVPGLSLHPLELASGTAKFDWTLTLTDRPTGFSGHLEFNRDLFERDTVARAMAHLQVLLSAAVSSPDMAVARLPLLPQAESHKLLVEWNHLPLDYPRDACLHDLFQAQALRTPHAEALVDGSRSLSYAELDARSTQLAHSLRALGVSRETPVGICSKRSAELVVGLLAILKAGGFYVPLDPAYPQDRLSFIIHDSNLRFLLAHSQVVDSLPPHSAHVLLLDSQLQHDAPPVPLEPSASSNNIAYLIYTSGSTGRPKGVCIEHRNAVSFLSWARSVFSPEMLSSTLAATSIAFDLSVFELFLPLSLGGTVVLASNALELPSLPAASRVSLVNTVPSVMSELLRSSALPPSVRVVNLAGEPLSSSLVQLLHQQPGVSLVYDLYGPSETTTYSTFTLRLPQQPASIGRPISGTQVFLFDPLLQPVPLGVPGELFIGGEGVSRGYLGRPELTAERFIPHPFSSTPGARLYRTGDLARYRADGTLEYLGRTDFQVKVRGFRIELGEIETLLSSHPGVRQAVVLAREDQPGDKRLVAYVTASGSQAPDSTELRSFLKQQLPEHMLPSAFMCLEQLPLTPNGKINRKALPAPEHSESKTGHVAPRTPTEEKLAALWAEVLGVPRVGAEDHFFELGGHSLLATRVLSRLRSAFQVELPVRALFESPVLSALARRVDAAREAPSAPSLQAPLLPSTVRTRDVPLSFSQQRLWFLDQLEPGSPAYNLPSALRFSGALDVEALQRAFQELVRRHESLRTTFATLEGEPVQHISSTAEFSLPVIDLQDVSAFEREARALERIRQEATRSFDLTRGPLLRTCLLRLAPDHHVLLVTLHHIVSDGWSTGVLIREVTALYASFASGQQPVLPPLPMQYADFVRWQRSALQGEVLDAQLAFWKQQLAHAPPHLELPTDKARPAVQSFRGEHLPVVFPKALSSALKTFSLRQGVTPFMTLLAGFQLLLHRYSSQDDVCVGSPIAGRRKTELEGLIGFFVNTLVLRSRFSASTSFRQYLHQVRDTTLAAFEHQDVPFEKLVEHLQPQRDLSRSPFFQVMFVLQNASAELVSLPGLSMRPLELPSSTSKFDWTLSLSDNQESFTGALEYNSDLFERGTVARAMEHLQVLLSAAIASPDTSVARLPLLPAAEARKLLVEFNDTRVDYPRDVCLHQRIEAQVARTPEALALTFEGQSLTYAQLDARANQLAWHLRSLGVGPDARVALCLERSLDMVVALLATLKAGGAYVPLDPAYPQERLGWMLQDSSPTVLLAQHHLLPRLPTAHPAQVVCVDSDAAAFASQPTHAPPNLASPNSLAYLIFTSGSTGRPKGAMNEHAPVLNRLLWMQQAYGLSAQDVVLQKTPFSFDVSVWEFFWPLLQGARLVIARPGGHQDPHYLANLITQERVTTLHFVPSMLQVFLQEPALEKCTSLRRVVCSGEALPVEVREDCLRLLPWAQLHNLYGPTEAAVDVTFFPCLPGPAPRSVPIGRPVANTQMHVLDALLQPVPLGVAGELFIGGVQVGRGYLGRPELTAERFIPDPFSATPGMRLYRTGDVARWLPDGNLEYLGRADFQVKIRGLRIELGEIEAQLGQHPAVRQAVVVAREDKPGDKRLVAYLVAPKASAPGAAELRTWLQQRLPEHMVPSAFVCLEAFPLSPNGKLERRALPAPELTSPAAGYVAPRTPTEEQLAAVWTEVLGVPRVGAEDHFFELGGHSLLATRVLSRLRSSFQVELPVRALFESPVLSALARKVDAARAGQPSATRQAPPLKSDSSGADVPLAFAQQRLWFLDQLEPGSSVYNVPVAVRFSGALDTEALQRAFQELVHRHESLRTTFGSRDGQPIQLISPTAAVPLTVLDLQDVPVSQRETRAQELARQEAMRPFTLARGPLLRTCLLRLAPEDHVLLVTLHHIVSDGWSMGVLIREVASLYASFASGQWPSLPALPVQYADFARWQRSWLQGEVLDTQLSFWKQQLSGAPSHLELPTDKPRPTVQSFRGDNLPVALPKALSESLKAFSLQSGVTPFMTLLAGFQLLLHRYSSQDDVCVGSPIAGRRSTELEGLIGFFVNTVVLRSRVSASTSFRQYLHQVRDTTLAAFEHQDLPFEKLVEHLQPQRDLSRSPFFQVMFILQNAPAEALSLPGLSMRPLELASGTAKFEWTLALTDTNNGFTGALEYNRDLFERDTVARAMEHLQVLLSAAVSSPDMAVNRLPLLPQAEAHKLLVEWNHLPLDYPRDACLHDLFQAQALRTPHAEALVDGSRSLSYAELDARSTQLAHSLRALGVSRETPVGICSKRSAELVVGLLAILKAGGFYVPLDPAYPQDRLSFIIHDSNLRFLLAHSQVVDSLPSHSAHVLLLDSQLQHDAPPAPLEPSTSSNNIAYLIYTSGSTGRPKGVCIEHRNAVSFLSWARSVFSPEMLSSTLAATSIAFDLSVFELFLPLSLGGTVVLASNALELPSLPAASRVSLVNTVPSVMSELLRSSALPPSVRVVNLAGEPLSSSLVQLLHQQPGVSLVYDLYGPSETTTYSTFTLRLPQQPASIGRPISGTQVFLLDPLLQPVPLGVPGELFIGGEGVSRGYLGRPELTAERFIPHPFSSTPGARLYRTGDLARYRADGTLEYLGRTDFQVKVRGFRIELGEIETLLSSHPGVRQAVVLAREDRPGDKRLVAYVTASGSQPPDSSELRSFLKQQLPEHMLPSAFMCLEQLPLTPNGKINRKALPVPEHTESSSDYIAPRTPTEEKLAALWVEVLGVPRVGAEDNFFELGGHSLLATRVLSRLRSSFQLELPVRALFEAPTLSALARTLDTARDQQTRKAIQAPPLVAGPLTGEVPLAFAQQRLWFLDQLESGSSVYNIPTAFRISGLLDSEAMQLAFEELLGRHASLRTTFASRDGQPYQLIAPSVSLPLTVLDLQEVAASEREQQMSEMLRQEAMRPFDLSRGPLLRAFLLRLTPEDHVLLATLHHIVSDGWSMGVLIREVASLYASFVSGQRPSLPPLPVQYADFARWQRSWLQGEVLDTQLSFWKQQLSGAPSHLELPTDKPRSTVQSFRGDTLPVALPKALSESLKAFSLQSGVTPFMTLLAGFQLLLHRYSSQDDVCLGSPIAGRRSTELEGLIGFFVNTVVLRSRVSASTSFRQYLHQVRDTTLAAFEHQDLPFEKLVEHLQPQRDLSRSPIFQVMFILQNAPLETLSVSGLSMRHLELNSGTSKFDWTLALADTNNGFTGALEYNRDLFERDTVARAMEHLQVLLSAAVSSPDTAVNRLPLLPQAESHKLLVEWNHLPLDYPRDACLHDLFQAQALRTPHAEALVDGSRSLSYAELDARSTQLAHSLRALGVSRETPVGICSKRSAELVVGLLAILKAGGFYVPLDPAYPQDRLSFIIHDSNLRFLLAHSQVVDSLPSHSAHVLLLDSQPRESAPVAPLEPSASSNNIAYLIYTSGSTGRPKGVCIEHRNAVSFLSWARSVFSPEMLSSTLAATSIAFDLSVFELFLPLSLGGTVVLASNALELPSLPAASRVSLVNTVPSVMSELLRSSALPPSVRVVNLAGEPLSSSLVQLLHQQPGVSLVYDLYGPSETTTYSTFTLRLPQHPASIGRPISGTQVFLLDPLLQPVPLGVPGELFIGGEGVSRGYLGRPELTAERFIPHPFSSTPGARLYRTGDLARYRPDGSLEYLGRTDFQVKIRGFRIELGEIETLLSSHPGVRQAVVLAREDRPGDKRLVAYVTASGSQPPDSSELRSFLKQQLPEHMLPSAFMCLEQLPLTPNGKINRKALPAPEHTESSADYIAPRTLIESQLASLWSEVLAVPRVSLRDNFFELGGHSLLATRLMSRVHQVLGRRVNVLSLFQHPTIELLAAELNQHPEGAPTPRALVRLQAGTAPLKPLFLVHGAGGGVMNYQELIGQLGTARPIYALHDTALEGGEPLPESVEAMARRYVAQLLEVQPTGPYSLGGWSFGGMLALEMAHQLQARGETVDLLALIDTHAPLTHSEPEPMNLLAAFCLGLELPWSELPLELERMLPLEERARLEYVLEQAERAGRSVIGLDEAWRLYQAYERHVRAQRRYEPRPYAGTTVLFKAHTQSEDVAADGQLGWSRWLGAALEVFEVPGSHHGLLKTPHVETLAQHLARLLDAREAREAA